MEGEQYSGQPRAGSEAHKVLIHTCTQPRQSSSPASESKPEWPKERTLFEIECFRRKKVRSPLLESLMTWDGNFFPGGGGRQALGCCIGHDEGSNGPPAVLADKTYLVARLPA
jgi:hypothetical protein